MVSRFLSLFSLVGLVACSSGNQDKAVAAYASQRLGAEAGNLRVSDQSDLEGESHRFYLVTKAGAPVLVVVKPSKGELFDSKQPDAFDRVARAERAAARLGALGPERVALWYAALGGGVCPSPTSTDAHFASVEREPDGGVTIRYPAGSDGGQHRTCVVSLAADGSLRQGRLVTSPAPQASARPWRADMN